MNYSELGYRKISSISPKLKLGDPLSNAKEIISLTENASLKKLPYNLKGIKVGSVSVSQRGDLKMASEMEFDHLIKEIENA